MPNIGPTELILVLVIALIVLGPKRLPDVGRSLGSGIREFKHGIGGGRQKPPSDEQDDAVPLPAGGEHGGRPGVAPADRP